MADRGTGDGSATNSPRVEELPDGRMSTATRVLAAVFVTICVAFWIFAFSPWARDIFNAPDQLESETLVAELDRICADARSELFELVPAREAESPSERATTLIDANAILDRMTAAMAAIAIEEPDDRRLVNLWLDDWEIYLADRRTHVDRLRSEGDVRFLNTVADGIFVHERMDGFARVNDLENCETPGDV